MPKKGTAAAKSCPEMPLRYNDAVDMAIQIGNQIKMLADRNLCVPIVTPEIILQVRKGVYLIDPSSYKPLSKDKKYVLEETPGTVEYMPHEMSLKGGGRYSYTTSYYSLAVSILKLINMELEALAPTKLYYLLKRCLRPNPEDRIFIYV